MLKIIERDKDFIAVEALGRVKLEDYQATLPEISRLIREQGRLRMLFKFDGFAGFDLRGLLVALEFDIQHRQDFYRIAIVGDGFWLRILERLGQAVFTAEVRAFHSSVEDSFVRSWLGVQPPLDAVDRTSAASFPASDPPAY